MQSVILFIAHASRDTANVGLTLQVEFGDCTNGAAKNFWRVS
jgi:hypothetical protein